MCRQRLSDNVWELIRTNYTICNAYFVLRPHLIEWFSLILCGEKVTFLGIVLLLGWLCMTVCVISWGRWFNIFSSSVQLVLNANVRSNILRRYNSDRFGIGWQREVSWLTWKVAGKHVNTMVGRLAFCAIVYFVWLERNAVVFNNDEFYIDRVVKKVTHSIRLRVAAVEFWLFEKSFCWSFSAIVFFFAHLLLLVVYTFLGQYTNLIMVQKKWE